MKKNIIRSRRGADSQTLSAESSLPRSTLFLHAARHFLTLRIYGQVYYFAIWRNSLRQRARIWRLPELWIWKRFLVMHFPASHREQFNPDKKLCFFLSFFLFPDSPLTEECSSVYAGRSKEVPRRHWSEGRGGEGRGNQGGHVIYLKLRWSLFGILCAWNGSGCIGIRQ
jgi:hypothetical protein